MIVRTYTAREIDVIAAYCLQTGRSNLLTAREFAGRRHVYLRVAPSRNNQRQRINWADDFEFAAKLSTLVGP